MSSEEYVGSVTVLKAGHVYRITIPKKIIESMGLREGDKLLVYLDREGARIILKKP